jgi:hypothetical protein
VRGDGIHRGRQPALLLGGQQPAQLSLPVLASLEDLPQLDSLGGGRVEPAPEIIKLLEDIGKELARWGCWLTVGT